MRPFPTYLIFEEVPIDEVLDIGGIKGKEKMLKKKVVRERGRGEREKNNI